MIDIAYTEAVKEENKMNKSIIKLLEADNITTIVIGGKRVRKYLDRIIESDNDSLRLSEGIVYMHDLAEKVKNGIMVAVVLNTTHGCLMFSTFQFNNQVFLVPTTFQGIEVHRDARKFEELVAQIN